MITIPNRFADLPEFPDQFVVGCHRGSLGALRTRIDSDHPYPLGGELKTLDRIQSIEWDSIFTIKMKNDMCHPCHSRWFILLNLLHASISLLCLKSANPLLRSILFYLIRFFLRLIFKSKCRIILPPLLLLHTLTFYIIRSSSFWFDWMCSSISHFTSHPRTWDARIRILKR